MYTLRFYAKDIRGMPVERPSKGREYATLCDAVEAADSALGLYPELHVVHVVLNGEESAKCVVFR